MADESGETSMKWPDILVVVLYFLFVLAVGLYVSFTVNFCFLLFRCVSEQCDLKVNGEENVSSPKKIRVTSSSESFSADASLCFSYHRVTATLSLIRGMILVIDAGPLKEFRAC